ncbi:MAG: glycosyltransferase [bacterium]
MTAPARQRLCVVVSSAGTIRSSQLNHLAALGRRFDVTVVANATDFRLLEPLGPSVTGLAVGIERSVSPRRDLAALWGLYAHFRAGNYAAVYSVTPKAGLLAMLAARLAGIPVRLHIFTGQVWVTARGPMRTILRAADRLIAALATHVLADSRSQVEFLVAEGILKPGKALVLAAGSISGVDTRRFVPNPAARAAIRAQFGIGGSEVLFLYIGRLKRDKGLFDLARAFAGLARVRANVRLAIVGPDEEGLSGPLLELCRDCRDRVVIPGRTDRPEDFMAAADVLCLPSYREGFGSVVIEAAAAGIPSIGSRIYGVTDSIEEGVTGLLHDAADSASLLGRMLELVDAPERRLALGAKARERAIREFSAERVTAAFVDYLTGLL